MAVAVAVVGVFGALKNNPSVAHGESTGAAVGEIWNSITKRFYEEKMNQIFSLLAEGSEDAATYDDVESMLSEKGGTLTANDLRNLEFNKSKGEDIKFTIGGLVFDLVYMSKDSEGNIVLTLWLDSCDQDAWMSKVEGESDVMSLGDYYGLVKADEKVGLYSDWSADNFKTNDYNNSYIRAVTLNNGGTYAAGSSDNKNYEKSKDSVFALFTYDELEFSQYLIAPNMIDWQKSESGHKNESSSEDLWGNDKIWLPSLSEVGSGSGETAGLWQTSLIQRKNHTDSGADSYTAKEKIGDLNGNYGNVANFGTWLRSGNSDSTEHVIEINNQEAGVEDMIPNKSFAVRPAIHLNLTSAKDATVDPIDISIEKYSVTVTESFYTGTALTPEISLYENADEGEPSFLSFVEGVDYNCEIYSDSGRTERAEAIACGTYYIKINGIGNYMGSKDAEFVIKKDNLSYAEISIGEKSINTNSGTPLEVEYTGFNHVLQINLFSTNAGAVDSRFFEVKYEKDGEQIDASQLIDVGEITITITATGENYDSESNVTATLSITAHKIGIENISFQNVSSHVYSGEQIFPTYEVLYDWNGEGTRIIALEKDTDFTETISDNVSVGNGQISLEFTGNYTSDAPATSTFEISSATLKTLKIVVGDVEYPTGNVDAPDLRLEFKNEGTPVSIKITDSNGKEVVISNLDITWTGILEQKDTLSGTLVNAGICTVTVSVKEGNENYAQGTLSATIEVLQRTLSTDDIEIRFTKEDYSYTGEEIDAEFDIYLKGTEIKLNNETDYTFDCVNNTDATEDASIQITFKGNYNGTATGKYTISQAEIDVGGIEWQYDEAFTYDGDRKEVLLKEDTIPQLVEVNYSGNSAVEANEEGGHYSASVELICDSNHKIVGSVDDLEWVINPKEVDVSEITLTEKTTTFTSNAITIDAEHVPEGVQVVYSYSQILSSEDHPVASCIDVGKYRVTAIFQPKDKNYKITGNSEPRTAELTINKLNFSEGNNSSKFNVSLVRILAFTGQPLTPTVTVTMSGTTKTLRLDTDYYVTYDNNTQIGTATVTIHGKGNYDGELTDHFEIRSTVPEESGGGSGSNAAASRLDIGLIIGVVVGVVVVFAVTIVVVIVVIKKRRNQNND